LLFETFLSHIPGEYSMYYLQYVYTWIGKRTWLVISTIFSKTKDLSMSTASHVHCKNVVIISKTVPITVVVTTIAHSTCIFGCLLSDPIPVPKKRIICKPVFEQIDTYYTAKYATQCIFNKTQKKNKINTVSKKQYTWFFIITSANVDRFPTFFHCQIPEEILYADIMKIVRLIFSTFLHYPVKI